MTTPADLAADAARRARKTAVRKGIMLDRYVEPAPTLPEHVIRLQAEVAAAQLDEDRQELAVPAAAIAGDDPAAEDAKPAPDERTDDQPRTAPATGTPEEENPVIVGHDLAVSEEPKADAEDEPPKRRRRTKDES